MTKYYAVGVTGYGSKQKAQFVGIIEAKNLTEARRQGFAQYRNEWFDPTGGRQLAVVGKAGYERYWKEACER